MILILVGREAGGSLESGDKKVFDGQVLMLTNHGETVRLIGVDLKNEIELVEMTNQASNVKMMEYMAKSSSRLKEKAEHHSSVLISKVCRHAMPENIQHGSLL